MKKTYIKPAILIAQLAIHKMICLSEPNVKISTNDYVDADEIESRRRRSGVWDDDDDEYDY